MNEPDLGYTGEYNAGAYSPALTSQLLSRAVQLTTAAAEPFYQDAAGRAARVRIDLSMRRCAAAGARARLVVHDSLDAVQGSPLLEFAAAGNFSDRAAVMRLPTLSGTAPYYLGVQLLADSPGEWDGYFRITPYGQWGWEGVTLCTEATMADIEDDLFNSSIYQAPGYAAELRRAKADVRLRLLEARIDPDAVWCDGALASPGDPAESPSGIGTQVIASLVLPATHKAIAHAYARVTGYKDGRIADKAAFYRDEFDDAMRGAIKSLLPVNEGGDAVRSRQEDRPERPRRAVM